MSQELLLRASVACGANSALLGRWLDIAGDVDRLVDVDVCHEAGIKPDRLARLHAARGELPASLARHWQLVSCLDPDYPPLLNALADKPGVLFVRGNIALLSSAQLAIVGARGASTEGLDNAFRFARALAGAGFTITSGLALGIDSHAHCGALTCGKTLAVLGHGPDFLYPKKNTLLAEQVLQHGGALVTEFPPGIAPHRAFFPARNRVISGLSLGTIIIEAALHSGSLITARQAAQQGREVFAVPGSIHNPLSRGCHQLLRDGANWLESIDDVLAAFEAMQHTAQAADVNEAPAEHPLLRHFVSGVNALDQLVLRTQQSAAALSQSLFELEMAGLVQRVPGGYSRRHTR